jgi:hypothetical protein
MTRMHTLRELTAYDIRRDVDYALGWINARLAEPDSPGRPGRIAAAESFVRWCCDANDELLHDPGADVQEIRQQWRLAAAASDITFLPYQAVYVFAMLLVCVAASVVTGVCGVVWSAPLLVANCVALIIGVKRLKHRLAVGPDANYSTLATAHLDGVVSGRPQLQMGPQRRVSI